jgi:outer membrane lipoprotein SlyB
MVDRYAMTLRLVLVSASFAAVVGLTAAPPANAVGCFTGGVAGAVAGHMAHHGVLGAVGGCIAGHEYRKHKERAEEERSQPQQQPNGSNEINQTR